jgi:hypothetical protein
VKRLPLVVLFLVLVGVGSCAEVAGLKPADEAASAPSASTDPDVEPLPVAKKRPRQLDARSPRDASL